VQSIYDGLTAVKDETKWKLHTFLIVENTNKPSANSCSNKKS